LHGYSTGPLSTIASTVVEIVSSFSRFVMWLPTYVAKYLATHGDNREGDN
jgi:hypothetical protein